MQLNIDKFNNMLGRNLSGDEIRSLQIHSMALGALINDAVFENEYKNIGLLIDEKVIAQNTKEKIPQLYNDNNKLNDLALKNFLQEQRLKIDDVVQIIEFETKDNFFTNAFFNISYPKYFSTI